MYVCIAMYAQHTCNICVATMSKFKLFQMEQHSLKFMCEVNNIVAMSSLESALYDGINITKSI